MAASPYQILGVSENATPDEIKKAYRKKARENHPDLNPNDPSAAERMNQINDAYDRLMNPQKYASRDHASSQGGYSQGASGYQGTAGTGYQGSGGYQSTGGYQWQTGSWGAGSSRGSSQGSSQGGSQQGYAGPYGWSSDFGFNFDDLFGMGFGSTTAAPEPSASDSAEVRQAISYINAGRHAEAARILNAIPSYGRDARWHYLAALANHGAGNEMLALDQIRRACEMEPNNMTYRQAAQSMRQPATSYQQQAEQRGFSVGFIDPFTACCGCIALQSCCYPVMCFRPF